MVDAIRELFKMAPLYGDDPLCSDRKVAERFDRPVYNEVRCARGTMRYEPS